MSMTEQGVDCALAAPFAHNSNKVAGLIAGKGRTATAKASPARAGTVVQHQPASASAAAPSIAHSRLGPPAGFSSGGLGAREGQKWARRRKTGQAEQPRTCFLPPPRPEVELQTWDFRWEVASR
jgi:hypothetical protein